LSQFKMVNKVYSILSKANTAYRTLMLFFILLTIGLQSLNAQCTDNENCSTPQTIALTTGTRVCTNDCNTGATSGPDFTGNNCYDFPDATVWYEITTGANDATLLVELTSAALTAPYFTVFTTTDCLTYNIINCTEGAAGSATNTVNITVNTTYLIAVSDQNGLEGSFDLCLTLNVDNSSCNTNNQITVTNTSLGSPLTGPFLPGEVVTFCYNITDFTQVNCNYLQGIVPTFGDCWDPVSFNAQGQPVNITTPLQTAGTIGLAGLGNNIGCVGTPSGTWSWFPAGAATYNNISGSLPPNTPLPGGWFFLSSYNPTNGNCSPDPTDPDNSYGDGSYPACGTNTLDWTVCFQLQARGNIACTNGQTDCTVTIKSYADGEVGIWNNVGCTADLPTVFPATLSCCVPPTMTDPADQAVCAGQPTTAVVFAGAGAGATYSWTNNNASIGLAASGSGDINAFTAVNSGNAPVTATITVTPFNVCAGTQQTFIITVNPTPNITAGNNKVLNCTVTSVTLDGASTSTNPTFSWSGPGIVSGGNTATPTVNAAGTYTLTVTAAGCTATDQADVTVDNTPPVPNINPATADICAGQSINLIASGGSGFLWSTAQTTAVISVSPAINTTYSVTVTAANGCTAETSRQVNILPTLNVVIDPPVAAICGGQSITLTASGGATYLWSTTETTASITVNPLTPTTYSVTATDAGGCTGTTSRLVTINPALVVDITPASAAICEGESISLTASGGDTYLWSTTETSATITASPLTNTLYSVTATDVNGCTGTASRNVTVNTLPVAAINPSNAQTCFGQPVTITASGGANYLWSTNETTAIISANPISTTTYTVTVTSADNCTATASATVDIISNVSLTTLVTNASCFAGNDGSIDITVTGGTAPFTFLWNDNNTAEDRTGLIAGNYSVTATGADGCAGTITADISEPSQLTVVADIINEACAGNSDGSISLTVNGGTPSYSYLWFDNDASQNKSGLAQGNYAVTVSDNNGCSVIENYNVGIEPPLDLNGVVINPSCPPAADGEVNVSVSGGNGGYTFIWSDNSTNVDAANLLPGDYDVTVTDSRGCTTTANFSLSYQYQFDIIVSPTDTTIIKGLTTSIIVTANVNNSIGYVWTPAEGLSCTDCASPVARPLENTTYNVVATDANGCTDTDSALIKVEDIGNIYVPNSFSPNGDGANDVYQLFGVRPEYMKRFYFAVYDRWGEQVFSSEEPDFKWDGTFKGKELTPAVFVYYLKFVLVGGDTIEERKGSILLLR
jgi:gliding motility-associated-like protein